MKEYRYKGFNTLIKIIVYLIIFICSYLYISKDSGRMLINSSFIFFSFTVIFAVYYQIKFDKMYSVYTNPEKLIVTTNKGWISEETSMIWEDIRIIRCYRKYIIFKKLYISTRYKSVTLNIRNFKNYKEMLKIIIEKTENNKNIRIDQAVYEMIK